MTCPTLRGKNQASGRPINLLTQHAEGDAKTTPPRRHSSSIPTTSFSQSWARLADCKRKKRVQRGRDARPGWRGRRGRRRAALLSCRGSSSPKFPGSLPRPDHPRPAWSRNPGWAGATARTPRAGTSESCPFRVLRQNPLGCQDAHAARSPNGQCGLGKVTKGKGCAPLDSPLLHTPPNSLPPHIPASI